MVRRSGEFDLIARYFAPLARSAPLAFGLKDDAAAFRPPPGYDAVLKTDGIIAGVHFLDSDPPRSVAAKLLRVNLSDLAAKGATPVCYLMTIQMPSSIGDAWVARFARGLGDEQRRFGLSLVGGDTMRTPGPLALTATLVGTVPKGEMLLRSGARPGDRVFVTGSIGDGGFGLECLKGKHRALTKAERERLVHRYRVPQPRLAFGQAARRIAHAGLDVSDGLVADLGHLCSASGVGAAIDLAAVPLSRAGRSIERSDSGARLRAIAAGDDYEILLAVPPRRVAALRAAAARTRTPVTEVGRIVKGEGVQVLDEKGRAVRLVRRGFTHF